jgi:hypothetical protein
MDFGDDFELNVSDETAEDYQIRDNVAENFVDAIRSDMVANEGPFLALNATYATGLFANPDYYNMTIVRGKSGEGKSELKQNTDSLWPNQWLLRVGSTSDMGLVDSERWDSRYIGAFAEFQQMQGKQLEMIKSSASGDADEDGIGFTHSRNVDDGDGGRDEDVIEKKAMPVVFLFADENSKEIPKELETRMMTVRVEADGDINEAVIATMFDHEKVSVSGRDYEYNYNFDDGKNQLRSHIASIPRPLNRTVAGVTLDYAEPVVIPHDDDVEWPVVDHSSIDAYGWDVNKVLKSIFNPEKSGSKRAGKAVANHIRAWTLLNYHNRERMEINGQTHYVAEPTDVGNVLSYRDLLLNVTHGINEQKLAVIEALTDDVNGVGGPGPSGGYWATHKDIREYISEYASITSVSKSQLTNSRNSGILDQMEEEYLIEVHEGDGPNGAHMYEFLGGETFGHPNLDIYPDLFEPITDPIRDQPIAETVREFEDSLSVTTTDELMSDDTSALSGHTTSDTESQNTDDDGGLSNFTDEDDTTDVSYDEIDCAVAERLQSTVDDVRITDDDRSDFTLQHMLGVTDVEYYEHSDNGLRYVRADGTPEDVDKAGTVMDSNHELHGDMSQGQIDSRIKNSVAKLREHGQFDIVDGEEDGYYMIVEVPNN